MPMVGEKKCALVLGAAPHTAVATMFRPSVMPTPDQIGVHAWALAPATICTQIVGAISGYITCGALARFLQMLPPACSAAELLAFLSSTSSTTTWRPSCWAATR